MSASTLPGSNNLMRRVKYCSPAVREQDRI